MISWGSCIFFSVFCAILQTLNYTMYLYEVPLVMQKCSQEAEERSWHYKKKAKCFVSITDWNPQLPTISENSSYKQMTQTIPKTVSNTVQYCKCIFLPYYFHNTIFFFLYCKNTVYNTYTKYEWVDCMLLVRPSVNNRLFVIS